MQARMRPRSTAPVRRIRLAIRSEADGSLVYASVPESRLTEAQRKALEAAGRLGSPLTAPHSA
jgi:hypothetical protein